MPLDNPLLSPDLDPNGLKAPTKTDAASASYKPSSTLSGATQGINSGLSDRLALDRVKADIAENNATVPQLRAPPKQEAQTDPFQAFGQPAMLIAALGSLFTRQPFVNAIKAGGAVLQATQQLDAAAAKQNFEVWKIETENGLKMAQFQQKHYEDALRRIDVDSKSAKAEIETNIAAYRDMAIKDAYEKRGVEGVKELLFARHKWNDQAAGSQAALEGQLQNAVKKSTLLASDEIGQQMDGKIMQAKEDLAVANSVKGDPTAKIQASHNLAALEALKIRIGNHDDAALQEAKNSYGLTGKWGTKPPAGSSADIQQKTEAMIQKDHPEMDPGTIALKAKELIHGASEGGAVPPETAGWIAKMVVDTGNMELAKNWGRSPKARETIATAIMNEANKQGKPAAEISDLMVAFHAQMMEAGAEARTTGTRVGAIETSAAEAGKTIPIAQAAFDKLPRGEFRPLNVLQSMYANGTTSPQQAAAMSADLSAVATYARALSPQGVGRESEIVALSKLLSTSGDSPESHKATLDQWMIDIKALREGSKERRDQLIRELRSKQGLPPAEGGASDPGAVPDGSVATQDGIRYRKQGGNWVPVQ